MRHHDYELAPGAKSWTLIQIDPYIVEHLALQPDCARLARPFAARPDSAQWHRIETLAHWLREVTAANARDPLVIRIVERLLLRSEERRGGKEGVSTCSSRGSPYP